MLFYTATMPEPKPQNITRDTGDLFGDLWHRYDDRLFKESVALFARRFEANGFDLSWFMGKRCLDAGCGGGRYSIAMAQLGATVVGCDISREGIEDCKRRAGHLASIDFRQASVLDLPFPDESFDFVCSSGVLHHTTDPELGLREITRVLRPGGRVFLLLYGVRGIRWPTIMAVRPYARGVGYECIDRAMREAGLPANKQRTFLDDLFVPLIAFYEWNEVHAMLLTNGYTEIQRWEKAKLDHESSVMVQREELVQLRQVFEVAGLPEAARVVSEAIATLDNASPDIVFGAGHHRVLATKQN